jgi:hypothetical protein
MRIVPAILLIFLIYADDKDSSKSNSCCFDTIIRTKITKDTVIKVK